MENEYLDLLHECLLDGAARPDRTGTGVLSLFGRSLSADLREGFPLLTTKRVNFRAIVAELLWMVSGSTNANDLDSKIWDAWADPETGDLGPIYGAQWRHRGKDQLARLVDQMRTDPYSRRHILSAWNPDDIDDMALAPCHALAQWYVTTDGELSCQMYQRSADIFLGVPFNIAQYSLLTHMLAATLGLKPRSVRIVFGDVHLYVNHQQQAREQCFGRIVGDAPTLRVSPRASLFDYRSSDFELVGYEPLGPLPAPVAV